MAVVEGKEREGQVQGEPGDRRASARGGPAQGGLHLCGSREGTGVSAEACLSLHLVAHIRVLAHSLLIGVRSGCSMLCPGSCPEGVGRTAGPHDGAGGGAAPRGEAAGGKLRGPDHPSAGGCSGARAVPYGLYVVVLICVHTRKGLDLQDAGVQDFKAAHTTWEMSRLVLSYYVLGQGIHLRRVV